jgi:hypothetical protein
MNLLINWQRTLESNLNKILSSSQVFRLYPGADILQVLFRSYFNIFGHPVMAVLSIQSVLLIDLSGWCISSANVGILTRFNRHNI